MLNKFLLAGDKFMPEMHLKQHGKLVNQVNHDLLIVHVDHLPKIKKEIKNLKKKQEPQDIFTKKN